jgi:hypothetical protein
MIMLPLSNTSDCLQFVGSRRRAAEPPPSAGRDQAEAAGSSIYGSRELRDEESLSLSLSASSVFLTSCSRLGPRLGRLASQDALGRPLAHTETPSRIAPRTGGHVRRSRHGRFARRDSRQRPPHESTLRHTRTHTHTHTHKTNRHTHTHTGHAAIPPLHRHMMPPDTPRLHPYIPPRLRPAAPPQAAEP